MGRKPPDGNQFNFSEKTKITINDTQKLGKDIPIKELTSIKPSIQCCGLVAEIIAIGIEIMIEINKDKVAMERVVGSLSITASMTGLLSVNDSKSPVTSFFIIEKYCTGSDWSKPISCRIKF